MGVGGDVKQRKKKRVKANILDCVINGNWRKIMAKSAYVSVSVNNKDR